jgi:hypothetical protein
MYRTFSQEEHGFRIGEAKSRGKGFAMVTPGDCCRVPACGLAGEKREPEVNFGAEESSRVRSQRIL